jgi:hypothetical protein
MFGARPGSFRAPRLGQRGHNPTRGHSTDRRPRPRTPSRRSRVPVLEILEDRNLLTGATPGAFVLNPHAFLDAGGAGLPYGYSPAATRHAYGFDRISFLNGTVAGDGTGQTIAIVDAYDQPDIAANLAAFDATFGVQSPPSFTKVNQYGGATPPAASPSWGLEISLDVEWAHAVAPGANILLVEAYSPSWTDLLTAVNYARYYPGVSVVSMSFGGPEWSGESAYDSYFTTPAGHGGVTFVASSGDSGAAGAPEAPSVSPNVLAVGGTQLFSDENGSYLGEVGWNGSGGGVSLYQGRPAFQGAIAPQNFPRRAVPDVSYNGSPNSPFAVYDTSYFSGWIEVYGTSAGAPQWAGLVAIANQGRALVGMGALDGPTQLLPAIYSLPAADFHDVAAGNNGGYAAAPGYDLVTGRGSPLADAVVASLAGPAVAPAKPSYTSVASNANPGSYGQSVTLTAQVYGSGGRVPTGMVTFFANGVVLGKGSLDHGTAAFTTAWLPPGGYEVTAVYGGDTSYQESRSDPLFQIVMASATTIDLSSSVNPSTEGQGVTFTAVVSAVGPGRGTPTGIVYFVFDGTTVVAAALSSGVAAVNTPTLGTGSTGVNALYAGDGHFLASYSDSLTQAVNARPRDHSSSAASPPTAGSAAPPSTPGASGTTALSGFPRTSPGPVAAGGRSAAGNSGWEVAEAVSLTSASVARQPAGQSPSGTRVPAETRSVVATARAGNAGPDAAGGESPACDLLSSAEPKGPPGALMRSAGQGDVFAFERCSEFEAMTAGLPTEAFFPRA